MALVIKDRVKEASNTTGTDAYTLNGAEAGFQSFAVIGDGNTTYYAATDGTNWEVGVGTYSTTGPQLSRTTILSSSNGGAAVSWGAGEKLVFVTQPASKAVYEDTSDKIASGSKFAGYIDLEPIAHPDYAEGRLFYDSEHKALAVYLDEADITQEVGQETFLRVYNNSGSTIENGMPVAIAGQSAGLPTVVPASSGDADYFDAIGVATHSIENSSYGYVTVYGIVRDMDTSGLTAGSHIFVGATAGTLTSTAPSYPSYPATVGWCLVSHPTTGSILVAREPNTIERLRVSGDSYIGGNMTISGDLVVQGTQTVASSENVSIGSAYQYLNAGDTVGEANTVFTGTGTDDAYFTGHYTGTTTKTFYVQIDGSKSGTGGVDTFKWSYNSDMSSPEASTVNVSVGNTLLADGISIYFADNKVHTVGDKWAGAVAPTNVDSGIWSNRNTGETGVGYTHMGYFFDVSDQKFKFVGAYEPEPEGSINTSDASFSLGTVVAATFEGSLSGNATTATRLQTSRTIQLTGDVTGSANFNGTANAVITTTVANDSHTHSDYVQKTGDTMTGTLNVPTIDLGDWTITESGGSLYFAYQGTNKFKLDSTGSLSVTNDVLTDATL